MAKAASKRRQYKQSLRISPPSIILGVAMWFPICGAGRGVCLVLFCRGTICEASPGLVPILCACWFAPANDVGATTPGGDLRIPSMTVDMSHHLVSTLVSRGLAQSGFQKPTSIRSHNPTLETNHLVHGCQLAMISIPDGCSGLQHLLEALVPFRSFPSSMGTACEPTDTVSFTVACTLLFLLAPPSAAPGSKAYIMFQPSCPGIHSAAVPPPCVPMS